MKTLLKTDLYLMTLCPFFVILVSNEVAMQISFHVVLISFLFKIPDFCFVFVFNFLSKINITESAAHCTSSFTSVTCYKLDL